MTAARALHADAAEQDGRCSLTIDRIDVLVDLDKEADALHCYVEPNSHDGMESVSNCWRSTYVLT